MTFDKTLLLVTISTLTLTQIRRQLVNRHTKEQLRQAASLVIHYVQPVLARTWQRTLYSIIQ